MRIPARLRGLRAEPGGARWLDELPERLERAARTWDLRVGEAYPGSNVSFVAPAVRDDGSEVVLKLQFPHPEVAHEAEALRLWDGQGAVRLLAHDPEQHALLLERCTPGQTLSTLPLDEALAVLVELLPALWRPAGPPLVSLAEEARGWASSLVPSWERTGRPCERRLVDAALHYLEELPPSQEAPVLLSQDLHGDNVLSSERGWLAIDPKPLYGERAFSLVPLIRSSELGHSPSAAHRRLDTLTAELGLDRERTRGWTIAHTVAWCLDEDARHHLAVAQWLLDGIR